MCLIITAFVQFGLKIIFKISGKLDGRIVI